MRSFVLMSLLTPVFCFGFIIAGLNSVTPGAAPPDNSTQKVAPAQPQKPRPGSKVDWHEYKPVKKLSDPSWGDYLTDIENHLPEKMGTQYRDADKNTWAHETTHGINSHLNNTIGGGVHHYCLYVGHNKAVKIKNPNFKISHVANMVPKTLRKSRYNLYLVKQQSGWNDRPVYLWDEWVAYCNGAECGIELLNKKLWKCHKTDAGWSVLEFSVYSTYMVMAQIKHDPTYDNKQMIEFLAWNMERTMKLYKEGQKLPEYNWDNDEYLKHLRTSPDASEFRKFLTDTYGAAWTKEILGF